MQKIAQLHFSQFIPSRK